MKTGILGGVFNPVHTAHLIAAEEVRQQLNLDRILFIPAANPPHKNTEGLTAAEKRFEMVRLAVSGNTYFEASDIEIKMTPNVKSYTVDTLAAFKEKYKNDEFYLIIGMDQFKELHTWKEPQKLFRLSKVVVINRPGFTEDMQNEFSKLVTFVKIPYMEISSSTIRERIKENKSIRYLVPEKVEEFIIENNLYK